MLDPTTFVVWLSKYSTIIFLLRNKNVMNMASFKYVLLFGIEVLFFILIRNENQNQSHNFKIIIIILVLWHKLEKYLRY